MSEKVKVFGILSAHFLPHLGGVERYVYNLAKGLIKQGKKVLIITSAYSSLPNNEDFEGITVYRLPAYGLMNGRMPIIKYNKQFRQLVKEIENKYDIEKLIINTHLYTLSCWGARWGKKHSKKIVFIGHGTEHMDLGNGIINRMANIYEHMLMGYIKKYVTNFYGVSLSCNNWLKHFSINAKGVFYNAVNVSDFVKKDSYLRKELNISSDTMLISFVGRIIEDKGIRKLCEAVRNIDDKEVTLIVAGDGEIYNELRTLYPEVIWLGSVTHDKVIDLLYETDIFALPTDYPEGFPTGVLEAAMCGCCIITTNAGGSKELIIDDSYGIILKENSVPEIKDTLVNFLEHKEKIYEKGSNVQKRVKEKFTWEVTVEKVIEELENEQN